MLNTQLLTILSCERNDEYIPWRFTGLGVGIRWLAGEYGPTEPKNKHFAETRWTENPVDIHKSV